MKYALIMKVNDNKTVVHFDVAQGYPMGDLEAQLQWGQEVLNRIAGNTLTATWANVQDVHKIDDWLAKGIDLNTLAVDEGGVIVPPG